MIPEIEHTPEHFTRKTGIEFQLQTRIYPLQTKVFREHKLCEGGSRSDLEGRADGIEILQSLFQPGGEAEALFWG
jgi:hypothetical protein